MMSSKRTAPARHLIVRLSVNEIHKYLWQTACYIGIVVCLYSSVSLYMGLDKFLMKRFCWVNAAQLKCVALRNLTARDDPYV